MSLENQEQFELDAHGEAGPELQKRFRVSYTRDFLLSLSDLDVCKKLPSGFDESILSEFEDVSQDRYRPSGGLTSQSYRRNDYSSSPPTRGDGSRSIHGRWDSRSSGRSDRDSDSQPDLDSDSARRGNQPRRSFQVPEHDGLLGSGSFPRPAGYVSGTSVPKSRANDQYPLSRSNEPYHPPRPYKAVPHSRRETDSLNDETFGSSEHTSEDRAEEERKRRASFEMMRKEQHKSLQEKQKNPEKSKDSFDFSELVEDPKDNKRFLNKRNESNEPVIQPTSHNDSDKSSFPSAAPVSRPLVPPGFSSPIVEKNIGNKSLIPPQPLEIGNEPDSRLLQAKGNRLLSGDFNNQEDKLSLEDIDSRGHLLGGPRFSVNKRSEKILNPSLGADISKNSFHKDNQSKVLEPLEARRSSEIMEHDANDMLSNKIAGESRPPHSTSILDKLFGSALTLNGVGPSIIPVRNDVKADDSHMVQSSKFAQWFFEEEKKPIDDLSFSRPNKSAEDFFYGRPNKPVDEASLYSTIKSIDDISSGRSSDLLSLIVGGEKSGPLTAFDVRATENTLPNFPLQLSGHVDGHVVPNSKLVTVETVDKLEAVPAVLTCEDLEQSILSEITVNAPVLQPPVKAWNGSVAEAEPKKAQIDNHASQHLLSLLQKAAEPSTDFGVVFSERQQDIEVENLGTTFHDSIETEKITNPGKALTLETLFGTAFMKELKSVGEPASGLRGPRESMRVDTSESSFPMMDNILGSTAGISSSIPSRGNNVLASNQRPQAETIGQRLLGFDIQSKADQSELRTEFRSNHGGFDGSAGVRFSEEDTLIAANDPLNLQNFISGRNLGKAELLSRSEKPGVDEKLAALNSVYQEERTMIGGQEGPTIFRGPYDMREPDVQYHNIHGQSSSPQLHPSHLNHGGPRFHPLDTHPNAQMKFMAPENNTIHHEPPNHQFPAHLLRPPFHHPSTGLTGLDPNSHNQMLQQMHIPGNFPPHLLRGFPRGVPLSPHPNNQATSYMQEPNMMQGFPYGQKQPNFGGPGIPPQGGDVGGGGHHPDTLQRIIEMEMRSNAKQMHPFPTPGHNRGVYGNEVLDMGFEFR
ncbi:hypothetical protein M5689_004791 [Euphorbia peplus]|nr:hypothetical protein M5689_004791 [Euphorbia peplus]